MQYNWLGLPDLWPDSAATIASINTSFAFDVRFPLACQQLLEITSSVEDTAVRALDATISLKPLDNRQDYRTILEHNITAAITAMQDASRAPHIAFGGYNAIRRAERYVSEQDKEVVHSAVNAVRSVLVCWVQLCCPLGNRDAYLVALEIAHGGPVEQEELSKILNAHALVVSSKCPSTFLSQSKLSAKRMRKGKSQNTKRGHGKRYMATMAENENGPPVKVYDEEAVAATSWEATEWKRADAVVEECEFEHARTLAEHGLVIKNSFLEVNEADSLGKLLLKGKSRSLCSFPLEEEAWKSVGGGLDILDYDCCSNAESDIDRSSILVVSEWQNLLVWHGSGEARDSTSRDVALEGVGDVCCRPGAKELIGDLVSIATLAITSYMNHWEILPVARVLLEQALPDTIWQVDESLEGHWVNYPEGKKYWIAGAELFWTPLEDAGDADSSYSHLWRHSGRLTLTSKMSCTWSHNSWASSRGSLTRDGTLVWTGSDGDVETWHRAQRSSPTILRCSSADIKVHIFHGNSVADEIVDSPTDAETAKEKRLAGDDEAYSCEEFQEFFGNDDWQDRWRKAPVLEKADSVWVWYRKELDRVWNSIAESGHGSFGVQNTVMMERMKRLCSHQGNVIEVAVWGQLSDEGDLEEMQSLRQFLKTMIACKPSNTQEYLANVLRRSTKCSAA